MDISQSCNSNNNNDHNYNFSSRNSSSSNSKNNNNKNNNNKNNNNKSNNNNNNTNNNHNQNNDKTSESPCTSSAATKKTLKRKKTDRSDCNSGNYDSEGYISDSYYSASCSLPMVKPCKQKYSPYEDGLNAEDLVCYLQPIQSVYATTQKSLKRPYSATSGNDDLRDPEFSVVAPSAKRRPSVVTYSDTSSSKSAHYPDDPGSVLSSVYPSPIDELADEIDTHSPDYCSSVCEEESNSVDIYVESAKSNNNNNIPDSPQADDTITRRSVDDTDVDTVNVFDDVYSVWMDRVRKSAELPTNWYGTVSPQDAIQQEKEYPLKQKQHPHQRKQQQQKSHSHQQKQHEQLQPAQIQIQAQAHLRIPHHGERTPHGQRCRTDASNVAVTATKQQDEDERRRVQSFDQYASNYECPTPAADPEPVRQCPLPALSWANAYDVWQLMCVKDRQAAELRTSKMMEQHPGLQPRMRAILLDWLIEVCEVYKLHRETYYLALDYLDRYLSSQKQVQKTHLQLIGITCLFVAAKVEEIYPPKIGEFAYVTDGACQESDILQHEILLLQALDWNISPVTIMGWLGVYMQLNSSNRTPDNFNGGRRSADFGSKPDEAFIYPQFSGMEFVHTAQLLDLCSLDMGISNYPYSVLAAAAMSLTFSRETALRCSGLDWLTIQSCARWMEPFYEIICAEAEHLPLPEQNEQIASKFGLGHICPNIVTDDSYIIQTHNITMGMFDRLEHYRALIVRKYEASPAIGLGCPPGLLTPPASSRKPAPVLSASTTPLSINNGVATSG